MQRDRKSRKRWRAPTLKDQSETPSFCRRRMNPEGCRREYALGGKTRVVSSGHERNKRNRVGDPVGEGTQTRWLAAHGTGRRKVAWGFGICLGLDSSPKPSPAEGRRADATRKERQRRKAMSPRCFPLWAAGARFRLGLSGGLALEHTSGSQRRQKWA